MDRLQETLSTINAELETNLRPGVEQDEGASAERALRVANFSAELTEQRGLLISEQLRMLIAHGNTLD